MTTLKNGLICGLLLIGCIVGLQASYLLGQLGGKLNATEQELQQTNREAQQTLQDAQAVLTSMRGTTETVRKSAVEQMGYYEATGRRSALALARLELLIEHTDSRMERATEAIETTAAHAAGNLDQIGALAAATRADLDRLTEGSAGLMDASTAAVQQLDARLADARLDQVATSLVQSSDNTAQATANMAAATGYIRDLLSPAQKRFWRRLLELLIPRPTVGVK